MIYGDLPEDLGPVDLSPVEMMYWMYCPVATPGEGFCVPPNLQQYVPILEAILKREGQLDGLYIYMTAKTIWVAGDFVGNRPGWHSDGFGTDDINYIWYDRGRTEFIADHFELPANCTDAMAEMTRRADDGRGKITYPEKHLLRLTPSVIHRAPQRLAPGMRTFVKVSISTERYNLEGNSINHGLTERWALVPRETERNHPVSTLSRTAAA